MDVIKAIPKKLLIHTVTLAREGDEDRWGNTKLVDVSTLTYVRMEPSSKVVRDKSGAEIQLAATLYYDCRNSRPREIVFAVDNIIIFNGKKHRIVLVEPLYDGKKLHHYELGVIAYA